MKKTIKLNFVDFWEGFDVKDNFITKLLAKTYDLSYSENPDYLFFSFFGRENLNYDCIKIFFTGENITPNFNFADYAIGFDHLTFNDRYIRIPLYALSGSFAVMQNREPKENEALLNRKFCSFVYSNNQFADPMRIDFYNLLSQYKPIDCGGALFNNVGGRVSDKIDFIKDYKFNIAFENSAFDGYTTEKIVDPLSVSSLPIYWGNPSIEKDFNKEIFINAGDFKTLEELVEYVVYLDQNDQEYLRKVNAPCFYEMNPMVDWQQKLEKFFDNIFTQDPLQAKRIATSGCAKREQSELKSLLSAHTRYDQLPKVAKFLFKVLETHKK